MSCLDRPRPRPEFHQLAIFLTVAETRSFAATARQIGCTQPAISQAIARLEEIYGGDLFERRRGAPLSLTPIGEAIAPSARILLHTVDEQMERAAQVAQSRAGTLTFGFSPGLAAGPLRAGIAEFVTAFPDVHLKLVESTQGDLRRRLIEGAIDLLIATSMPDIANGTLAQERLWDARLFVALPADHDLARHAELDWRSTSNIQVLVSTSNADLPVSPTSAATINHRIPRCEQHAVSAHALLDMVGIGMGATIVLDSDVTPQRQDVAFRPLVGEHSSVAVDAIWRTHDGNPLRHRMLCHIRDQRRGDTHQNMLSDPRLATAPAPDPD